MSLGRSPSQRFNLQNPAWALIPSGFSAVDPSVTESQNWVLRLIQAIDDAVVGIPNMVARINALKAQGKRTDFLEIQLDRWIAQAQRGLDWFANLIEGSTAVQSIIDNAAGVQTTPGLHEIRIGAWKELVSELRKPSIPLGGFGFIPIVVESLAVVGRALANPAVWAGVKNIFVMVLPYVGTYLITSNVKEIVNGSDDAKAKLEKCLKASEEANTTEEKAQVERLCAGVLASNNTLLWLLFGGAAGVGALLYFQSKGHVNVIQSRSAALSGMPRKRRRRKKHG